MSIWSRTLKPLGLALLFVLAFAGNAQAYLDPGSVSLFFQAVVASVLGGVVVLRLYWAKVRGFGRKLVPDSKKGADVEGEEGGE